MRFQAKFAHLAGAGAAAITISYAIYNRLVPTKVLFRSPASDGVLYKIPMSENSSLTTADCAEYFPELFCEADRAKQWWLRRGGITEEMVEAAESDNAQARVLLLRNKSFYGGINTRTQAALAALYRTILTSREALPDADFVIQTSDSGTGIHPHFSLSRTSDQEHLWLIPDFGYFSWPEPGVGAFSEVRENTLLYESNLGLSFDPLRGAVNSTSWDNKTRKLMWRGVPLVEIRQPWADIEELDWGAVSREDRLEANGDLKSPAEHCQYAFLAHVEGFAYSGRLKYLQQCRSVIVTHSLSWIQHYHHLLISQQGHPDQNVVEVPLPLNKHLSQTMAELLNPVNKEWVERIAANSWNNLREKYISPSANECYYRYAIRAYAEVQTFKPVLDRAVAYESFLLTGSLTWSPHK